MDAAEAEREWRHWAESEIGGSESRIETAMLAIMRALNRGGSADEVAQAAYDAVALFQDSDACSSETRGLFRGHVSAFRRRLQDRRFYIVPSGSQPPRMLIWSFRVDRTRSAGDRLPFVNVELRAPGLSSPLPEVLKVLFLTVIVLRWILVAINAERFSRSAKFTI